ncbi:flagellar hook-length control protein FliK [Burkholderia pseudomultivorans]|uniref:flagellar hook-length control protein FliK n=1 Tax=Burkholderia pseudomultivorans TaxID=1207504 RepID=UPI002EDA656F
MRQWPATDSVRRPVPRPRASQSDLMTESVIAPRSRSRSGSRSSARSRPRSAAAAGEAAAKTAMKVAPAPGGDPARAELTLDLFGDPVLEPGERASVAVRDEAVAQASAETSSAADDAAAGRQATLDGFEAIEMAEAATATGRVEAGEAADSDVSDATRAAAPGEMQASGHDEAAQGGGASVVDGMAPTSGNAHEVGEVAAKVIDARVSDAESVAAVEARAASGAGSASALGEHAFEPADATAKVDGPDDAAAVAPIDEAATAGPAVKSGAARSAADNVKERRSSSGAKRRTTPRDTAARSGPVPTIAEAASLSTEPNPAPETVPVDERPAAPQSSQPPTAPVQRDAGRPAAAAASPSAPSAAAFVTKPSAEQAGPTFDPETQLRPLSDRVAALQTEVAGLTRAADREMRRVNRLLLALAVVVLAGLVALVMQTRQIAHLKQDVAARQLRIDRLAADLSTQQATLMTLEEHHEALLSQVDRLQRNASREAAAAKRVRRTH